MLFQDVDIVNGMIRERTFDAHLHAPKGGVSIKGKEFKGGQFIPSEGGYAEEYEKMKKEGKIESSEEPTLSGVKYNYFKNNMDKDLSTIGKEEVKLAPAKGKLSIEKNRKVIIDNARSTLENYSNYLSTDCYGLARDSIYNLNSLFKDPSLSEIDSEHINQMVTDSVKKMVYQEIESNRQQFTDHGIRHIQGNIDRMNNILDIANGGKTSAMDKLMGFFIMVNHDVGYTAEEVKKGGEEGAKASGKHKDFSTEILESQRSQWNENKIFSSKQYDKILEIVKTHDDTKIDKNDLLGTSVRLSDNLSLFSKEKLPSMFKMIDGGKTMLIKMGEAAAKKDNKAFELYRDKMYKSVDSSGINANLKRDLKAAVKEIGYLTPKFTLGVLAGEVKSIQGSKDKINIDIEYNEWDSFLQRHFDMGQKQTKKLLGDYGITDFSKSEYDLGGFVNIRVKGYNPRSFKDEALKMETIECSKCGAIFEKTGAKDKLRRFKDKRFMTTFHCPNCDARVILKNGDEPISIYLKRLERLKEQARRLGDQQEVKELQEEINNLREGIKEMATKTKDVKPSMTMSFGKYVVKNSQGEIEETFESKHEAEEYLWNLVNEWERYPSTKIKDSKTADALFKGQKVTAIKSEQGLREGEVYTVIGEEEIVSQIIGEDKSERVFKLQDSSGKIVVVNGCKGLFYEVKDSLTTKEDYAEKLFNKLWDELTSAEKQEVARHMDYDLKATNKDSKTKDAIMECMECGKKFKKNLSPNTFEVKCPNCGGYDVDVISGDSSEMSTKESEKLKAKIGDIKKNMDAAKKMGYDIEPYQKEIEKLETKDSDKELSEALVKDAPDYYGAIVATARRGNNPRMGGTELRKNIEPFMAAHGVQFNEEEFNKAYKEFSKANVSKAAFMKGTDAKDSLSYVTTYKGYEIAGSDKNIADKFLTTSKGYFLAAFTLEELKRKIDQREKENSKDSSDIYTKDPLTKKGQKILAAMKRAYGEEKGEQIFYASRNKGTISGVDKKIKDAKVRDANVVFKKLGWKVEVPSDAPNEFWVRRPDGYTTGYSNSLEKAKTRLEEGIALWKKLAERNPAKYGEYLKLMHDSKTKECPNCKNQLTYAGEENGKTKYECKLCNKKYVSKDAKAKDWLDPEAQVLSEKVLRKMKEIHKRTKQTNIYDLFDDAIRGLGITGKIKEDVRILILQGANHRYTEEFIFKDAKVRDANVVFKKLGWKVEVPSDAPNEFWVRRPDGYTTGYSNSLEKAKTRLEEGIALWKKLAERNPAKYGEYLKLMHDSKTKDEEDISKLKNKALTKVLRDFYEGVKEINSPSAVAGAQKLTQMIQSETDINKLKMWAGDSKTGDQKIDKKFIASCPACQEMRAAGLSYEETHSSHTPGMILVEVNGREKEIPNPHITKDQEIKIIIGDDPVNPSPAEQKVEGNDVIYKEYTLKQLPEMGEFEIYAPGGSIVGHAKALELAKLFVDRVVASKVNG